MDSVEVQILENVTTTVEIPTLEISITEGGMTRLNNLSDVAVSSPENGQVLVYQDGSWKNGNPTISGSVDWNAVTNKPEEFPAESHTHTISEVVGLQDALDNVSVGDHDHDDRYYTKTEVDATLADKAEANHSHAISELSDVSVSGVSNGQVLSYQDGTWVPGTVSGGGGPVSYTDLLDVPSEFPPEAHSHTTDEVTGLDAALAGKASVTHSHSISDVTGLQAALDAKQDASEAFSGSYNDLTDVPSAFTPATHSHTVADVTGLQTALDGKAASSHIHAVSDITGLQAAIDQKLDASSAFSGSYEDLTDVPSTFTPSIHSHSISEVTGLQTALDGKASVSHSHDISDVTGLQTALDGKAASGISGQTGGTDGRVVRLTTTDDTWTDASNTDTLDQLSSLAFKQDGKYYTYGSIVTGLSNLTAGTVYYLSTSGQLTSTAPTPDASTALVRIGTAINTTSLYFTPGIPIGGE